MGAKMKSLIFLLIASIAMSSTIRYKRVYVDECMSLTDVVEATAKDGTKTYYYNNKRMDRRYKIVPCSKAERFCLIEKDRK
jgi:hypothetical protein